MSKIYCKSLSGGSNAGFTLTELLVVVLIIGVLAAVALPQYQKAVQKSRNAQLKTLVRTVAQAQKAYYMANGSFAPDFAALDLDLPLAAPSVTAGINNTCNLIVRGPDSIREGKDFQLVLNSSTPQSVGVVAVWTKGKYACAGIQVAKILSDESVICIEANRRDRAGDFCEQVENGVFYSLSGGWRHYRLP